ncbi:MAG: VIT1/CCC1 transporter family protein [Candidatus Micrarchaeota archaeon]
MPTKKDETPLQKSKRLEEHEKFLATRKKNALIASVILGGQDGVVNVLGVLLAVASATYEPRIVLIAGIAAAFTESISMLAVAYTSARAEEDYYKAEEEREIKEIEEMPEIEREEVTRIYHEKGFRGKQLSKIVDTIASNKDIWKEVMMREELGLEKVDLGYARKEAFIVGISAVSGSIFPLLPFFLAIPQIGLLSIHNAAWLAAVSSILALFIAGYIKAKKTTGVPWRSGLEMAFVGGVAALLGYAIGSVLRVAV